MYVSVCVCFLRPSGGGKFSRAIIRPQITALYSQKPPLLGPHQRHNEDFTPKTKRIHSGNMSQPQSQFKFVSGFMRNNFSVGKYFNNEQKEKNVFVPTSIFYLRVQAVQTLFSHFLWNTSAFTFTPVITSRLSGALKLTSSIVSQVNIPSHINDMAERLNTSEQKAVLSSGTYSQSLCFILDKLRCFSLHFKCFFTIFSLLRLDVGLQPTIVWIVKHSADYFPGLNNKLFGQKIVKMWIKCAPEA